MGMFDSIIFQMNCPNCGTKMDNFQSKDGCCSLLKLNFWEVNNFYCGCPYCNTWVEYNLKLKRKPNRKLTIRDYKKSVEIPTIKEQREHRKKYEEFAKFIKEGLDNENKNSKEDKE